MTYNTRRNFLGAIPIGERIAYHIFDTGYSRSKSGCSVKLLRKTKWNSDTTSFGSNWSEASCINLHAPTI